MPELKIANTAYGDMTNRVSDITIDSMNTDGATGQDETEYQNADWSQYWGYFNSLPDLKSAMLMKAIWVVGKGYTTKNGRTEAVLRHIKGWGKDTFLDILFNAVVISRINGDSYAEIIRDPKTEELLNLKPLDAGSMKIICDKYGIIKRYEQTNKTPNGTKQVIKFKPDEIFHLSNNRLADQIHGISDIKSMEQTILAENESFTDLKKIMHRQARPMIMFKLGTDDTIKIASFIKKMDDAVNKGENIYIPDDANSVNFEVVQVNVSQMVTQWRDEIRNKFYRALGLPLILFGQAGSTESGGKMEYLAHETLFAHDQKFIEEQIRKQLNLEINLVPPVSLLENLQTDQSKDANQGMEIQPNDVTAGSGA